MYYGWLIVAAAFALLAISAGVTYSSPLLFKVLETELGIGRGEAAFLFAGSQFITFMIGPKAGDLADRYGPRAVATGGVALLSLGLVGVSRATSYEGLLLSFVGLIGVANGLLYVPTIGLLQRWFVKLRARATGLATSGVSIGTIVFPFGVTHAIATYGWRVACVGLALIGVTAGLAAAVTLVGHPSMKGQFQDGLPSAPLQAQQGSLTGLTLEEALRTRTFYGLYFCGFGAAFLSFIAFVHLPLDAFENTGGAVETAAIVSLIGMASLASRVFGGALADYFGRRAALQGAFVLLLATSLMWLLAPSAASKYVLVALLFGLGYGLCIALLPAVIADCFGVREISRLVGTLYTSFALAVLTGPTLAGLLHDKTTSYNLALIVCVLVSLLTVIASFLIGGESAANAHRRAQS